MYKRWIDSKPSRIRFNNIDGLLRVYDGTRYLVLFRCEKYDSICNRIRYLISVKSGIAYVISYNYAKIKVDSYSFLPLEKTITFHVIKPIKSFWNENKNNSYYKIFLEKLSYELCKCYIMIKLTFLKELILI